MTFTHKIRFYGGNTLNVAIFVNRTNMDLGFIYGEMYVVCDKPDILGEYDRWVHFGIYNAIAIEPIQNGQ